MVSVVENIPANVICDTKFEDEIVNWFNPTVRVTIKYHVVALHEDQTFELMIPRQFVEAMNTQRMNSKRCGRAGGPTTMRID